MPPGTIISRGDNAGLALHPQNRSMRRVSVISQTAPEPQRAKLPGRATPVRRQDGGPAQHHQELELTVVFGDAAEVAERTPSTLRPLQGPLGLLGFATEQIFPMAPACRWQRCFFVLPTRLKRGHPLDYRSKGPHNAGFALL
jgi:hypothetical protein